MEFTINQIAEILDGSVEGDGTAAIRNFGKIQEAKPGDISFLANLKYEPYIYSTEASAVIVGKSFKPEKPISSTLIRVDDPYSSFTVLLEAYHRLTYVPKNRCRRAMLLR